VASKHGWVGYVTCATLGTYTACHSHCDIPPGKCKTYSQSYYWGVYPHYKASCYAGHGTPAACNQQPDYMPLNEGCGGIFWIAPGCSPSGNPAKVCGVAIWSCGPSYPSKSQTKWGLGGTCSGATSKRRMASVNAAAWDAIYTSHTPGYGHIWMLVSNSG